MSRREELIYAQMKADDPGTGPIEEAFFFPTEDDVKLAKKLGSSGIVTPNNAGTLAVAIRLVSDRVAVPVTYLDLIRKYGTA